MHAIQHNSIAYACYCSFHSYQIINMGIINKYYHILFKINLRLFIFTLRNSLKFLNMLQCVMRIMLASKTNMTSFHSIVWIAMCCIYLLCALLEKYSDSNYDFYFFHWLMFNLSKLILCDILLHLCKKHANENSEIYSTEVK